jgi:ornithine carbamoyltransferase
MDIPRHLTSLNHVSPGQFSAFLAVARLLKQRRAAGERDTSLAGRSLAMLFEKPSLRTRLSFEVGMAELGGQAMYIKGEEVGIDTREPVQDVARVLGRYVQGIMARVFRHQTITGLAQHSPVPVINGLSDDSHPCQALADFQTIAEQFGRIAGLTIVFVGDANNVSRSLAHACHLAGSRLVLACPKAYAFGPADIAAFGDAWGRSVTQIHDPLAAVSGADVLYTDVWVSMGQEAERAQRLRDFQGYQINGALIRAASPGVRVMHCLPAHRGEEITDEAMEHRASVVFDQAENRMHAQKAILRLLLARDDADRRSVLAAAGHTA